MKSWNTNELEQALSSYLHHPFSFTLPDSTGSTNDDLRQMARAGAPEWHVAAALEQTAGRGRNSRSWSSPPGASLSFSLLLRPQLNPDRAPMLTLVMAHAVTQALIRVTGCDEAMPGIKWPNDIVLEGKKVCGILTEMSCTEKGIEWVIIGTGINVNQTDFPPALKEIAISLRQCFGKAFSPERLLAGVLAAFREAYGKFLQTGDLSLLREEYEKRLLNKGREVRLFNGSREYTGIALGITDRGKLVVENEEGRIEVEAGEVSVRGLYSYV